MYEWQVTRKNRALNVYSSLARMFPEKGPIYHLHGSFGDIYLCLSLVIEAFHENKIKSTIIIDPKYRKLVEKTCYEIEVNVLFVDGMAINAIFSDMDIIGGENNVPIRLLPTLYPYISTLIDQGKLTHCDFIRTLVGSSNTGRIKNIEKSEDLNLEAKEIINKAELEVGRTLLISADNNSQNELPDWFWLDFIEIVRSCNWQVALNNSGVLNTNEAKKLSNLKLPLIKVPPHLAVTLPSMCGSYAGGTNGLSSIQAIFNNKVNGFHFINLLEIKENYVRDKFSNKIPISRMFHRNAYDQSYCDKQIEYPIDQNYSKSMLKELINNCLK